MLAHYKDTRNYYARRNYIIKNFSIMIVWMLLICKNPGGLSKLRTGGGFAQSQKKRVRIVRSLTNLIVIASFTCSTKSCHQQTSTLSTTRMETRLSTSLPMARIDTLYSSRAVKLKQTSNKYCLYMS